MTDVTVRWAAKRVGNDGYVREVRSDGTHQDFGPMPPHTISAFVGARRTLIEYMMRKDGAIKKADTTSRPRGDHHPFSGTSIGRDVDPAKPDEIEAIFHSDEGDRDA